MELGQKLLNLRKKSGLSQEEVAEKLGVSRQTISKWETNQTVPELLKLEMLCKLYNVSYDYIAGNGQITSDLTSIEHIVDQIDWTKAWSTKYPILASYKGIGGINAYSQKIDELYEEFKKEFGLNDEDTALVLKDILYNKFKRAKRDNK